MKKRLLYFIIFLSVSIFVFYSLHHLLHEISVKQILAEFHTTSWQSIFLCIGIVLLNYFVLTGYDYITLEYLEKPVPYLKTALTSFSNYAISHTVGLSFLTGGSIRYRVYSMFGLSVLDVAKLIIYCSLTFWLGVIVISGICFIVEPEIFSATDKLSLSINRLIGIILLSLITIYFLLVAYYKKPLRFINWSVELPTLDFSLKQICLGSIDVTLAATALYVLFPGDLNITFMQLLAVFLAAITIGYLSNAPGGIGVIEVVMLLGLPEIDKSVLLGTLIMYRCLYYLLPLTLAISGIGLNELINRKKEIGQFKDTMLGVGKIIIPRLISVAVMVAGAILLFSGSTPELHDRLEILQSVLPLPLIETSHLIGSILGVLLLIVSRGLFQRLDSAWLVTNILLIAGILFSLLKGFDYEEALILSFVLLLLASHHSAFYRKGVLLNQNFNSKWMLAVLIIIASSIWLGVFSYKHIEYSNILWWEFSYTSDASRFLRASLLIVTIVFAWFSYLLLRPVKPVEDKTKTDLGLIKPILNTSDKSSSFLALTGDKRFIFSEDKSALIMYDISGRNWISMGDPVGSKTQWSELMDKFQSKIDEHAGYPVFYQVDADNLPLYLDQGFSVFKFGEEACVDLINFSLEGSHNSDLRYTNRKLGKEGLTFSIVKSEETYSILNELSEISDNWLNSKSTSEKQFSVGSFKDDYMQLNDIAIIKRNNKIIAFANLWQTANKAELSLDLMRYHSDSPKGVMDYLFIQIMLWGQSQGFQKFSLGMAPLSGLNKSMLSPVWMKLGAFVFRHGEHFYNFEGLREYKNKFHPVWEPKYIACYGGRRLPQVMLDIASLIAGNTTKIFIK